ncbi:MAG: glycosyltransferase [Nitrospinales bacterium]
MKIAIVHDWLTGMRGGEKCLEVFCRLYPEADLFTLLHIPGTVSPVIEGMRIKTSFLQSLPGVARNYRYYLPAMPLAVGQFDLSQYHLVLSSSHCVAKGVTTGRDSIHICYCYTPMRYIWDQYDQYFGPARSGALVSTAMRVLRPRLKAWDVRSSRGVDYFVAISRHVQKRIQSCYRRDATVIYPPVDTKFYSPAGEEKPEDFFLMVSAFAPYKRLDLAVEAFKKLGYPLKIIGSGQQLRRLKDAAAPNIEFLGWLPDEEIRSHYARCRAFIFPGEEDFGITPLEAQGMGRPVIAFSRGGALETVIPEKHSWKPEWDIPEDKTKHPTGVFFHEQTPDALVSAVRFFESIENRFDPEQIRRHARQFDVEVFSRRIRAYIENKISPRC